MVEDINRVHARIDDMHGRLSDMEGRQAGLEARQAEHAKRTDEVSRDVKDVLIQLQAIALTIAGREGAGKHSAQLLGWFLSALMAAGAVGALIINMMHAKG